jgi:hypothetical protein
MFDPREALRAAPALPLLEPPTFGGGGTIFAFSEAPRIPEGPPLDDAEGGGGITLPASVPAVREPVGDTLGGGGTTSCVPKIFPMRPLTKDVLPAGVGGGGTTVGEVAPLPPASRRRRSRVESADGGGAITEGAGRLIFVLRALSRSGAETGGGTTLASRMRSREGTTSCPAAVGAGGITLVCKAGADRARSSETVVEGGAITPGLSDGAARVPLDGTFGAGAMTVGSSSGINRVCSEPTVGAGGTTAAFKAGVVRAASGETLGAGGITVLSAMGLRD